LNKLHYTPPLPECQDIQVPYFIKILHFCPDVSAGGDGKTTEDEETAAPAGPPPNRAEARRISEHDPEICSERQEKCRKEAAHIPMGGLTAGDRQYMFFNR
jgi:hypothetical protein